VSQSELARHAKVLTIDLPVCWRSYDVEVGYTQGVAFIVAALLLNMPDEEAFCVLVRLMESVSLNSMLVCVTVSALISVTAAV